MIKKIILFSIFLALSTGVIFTFAETAKSEEVKIVTIVMSDASFDPRNLEISLGDTVTFKNIGQEDHWPASNIHPTHAIYSEFDSRRPISPGERWEFTFKEVGEWKYHDHLYPQINGTITVRSGNTDSSETSVDKNVFVKILDFLKSLFERITQLFEKQSDITKDSKEIFTDHVLLRSYVKSYGLAQTIKQLSLLSTQFGSCHDSAHAAGRIAYELFGKKVFKEGGAECHSGGYHGATEAYFKEHGTANISEDLNTLCGSEHNAFFSHQCIHGVGHGLMAWSSYELNDALKSCDLLKQRQNSCWTGVFMENIGGGLAKEEGGQDAKGHSTKYLSDDPQYPCNVVDEKYKGSCYFLQTSRMVQLFNYDFKKVAAACLKAPEIYQYTCFLSMGRDVGGGNRKNPQGAIKACSYAPSGTPRTACLLGAAQDTFWDLSGQDDAILFCKLIESQGDKEACYKTIFSRAREVLLSPGDIKIFCDKAEKEYQSLCPR